VSNFVSGGSIAPELNSQEKSGSMRQNGLSNRIFKSFDDIALLRLERAHRPALENQVHRAARTSIGAIVPGGNRTDIRWRRYYCV
jgi:hypothetical protein